MGTRLVVGMTVLALADTRSYGCPARYTGGIQGSNPVGGKALPPTPPGPRSDARNTLTSVKELITLTGMNDDSRESSVAAALTGLVMIADIADRFGVRRNTVSIWQWRSANGEMNPPFPKPVTKIGTLPLWEWSDLEAWAEESGRRLVW